jgi:hypothetical protein
METTFIKSLSKILQNIHGYSGIKTHHIPLLIHCLHIEAPEIVEIQEFIKFFAYRHLMSHITCVLDDLDHHFLHSTSIPDVPCTGLWVQIIQPGIYKGDLAVVFATPSTGDIVMISVVSCFQNKKRKGKGNARPAPALLDPRFVAQFCFKNNIHFIRSHKFTFNGLELLQVASTHGLKIEPHPSKANLLVF